MPTLAALAAQIGGEVSGDAELELTAIMPLEWAGPGHISFYANPKYLTAAQQTKASALLTAAPFAGAPPHLLIHPKPYFAAAKLAHIFNPPERQAPRVHPSAVIGEPGRAEVRLGKDIYIGPHVVIEPGADIGDGCQLYAQTYVGENAQIGAGSVLHPGVRVLKGCIIGERCVLHAGVSIGGDGFGFVEDDSQPVGKRWQKIPQLGIVMVGDDVEIGANSAIDRATYGATFIKSGSKIDDLVMIGHNVEIGEDSVLVAQVGISGSTKVGRRVVIGGQAGIAGHLKIGDDVKIAGQTGISKSVPANSQVAGSPHVPAKEWMRQQVALRSLDEMRKRLLGIRPADETARAANAKDKRK